MKRITHIVSAMLLLGAVTFTTSCQKDFGDTNVNNNEPSDVPVNILLPSTQASLAYTLGGDIARFNAVLDQNVTGASRQFFGYNEYRFTEEDFDGLWNNMYAGNMNDLNRIIEKANAENGAFNAYRGIARVTMAYSLMTVTDLFGDVPFTQAFKGNVNTTPAYDSQANIYTNIIPALLDSAMSDFANIADDRISPGADDLIYGGDLAKWTMFAHGIKARLLIHQSKKSTFDAQKVIDEVNASFASSADNAAFHFGTNYQSPWYQYIDQRGDISYSTLDANYGIGCFHSDTMQALNDPRFAKMIDVNGDYYAPGFPSAVYMGDDAAVTLISYHELLFIKAEAYHRLGDAANAGTALSAAVDASMDKLGVDPADRDAYKTAHVDFTNATDKLGMIMFEKYIANYLQPESYTDWRRTGYPNLPLTANAATSSIPRRFVYPTSERQNNPNGLNQNSSLFTPALWWDN